MQFQQTKRWDVAETLPSEIDQELAAYPPFFRQLLFNRGIRSQLQAQRYLDGAVECDDPNQILGMKETVDRLARAIERGERMVVYGDYDADGVTATALMVQVIRRLGGSVQPYIPSRFDEGYGLNREAVEFLAREGAQLVLTVDCGIRSFEEAELAARLGVDLIVSDHHHPLQGVPQAYAVVCPRREGETYPEHDLAGVGLAYKIAQALIARFPGCGLDADEWLDLVAVGTVADVASLRGENRSLVRRGLEVLRLGRRPGLASLVRAASLQLQQLSTFDIGFGIGPRLNAAGRMDSAMSALELLLAEDESTAGLLAQQLDNHNIRRQDLMRQMQERAEVLARDARSEAILFAFHEDFNEGILGLAASRLADRYYRPAVVGKIEGEFSRASCRSIPEFHITHALDECKDLLVRHGGHPMAAGLTIRTSRLGEFIECLGRIAERELGTRELCPVLRADKELEIGLVREKHIQGLMRYLDKLQPTGQDNPEAVFFSRGLTVKNHSVVGKDRSHLKLWVAAGDETFSAIAFRQGHWSSHMPPKVDLMYQFGIDNYNGRNGLQLKILDLRPAS